MTIMIKNIIITTLIALLVFNADANGKDVITDLRPTINKVAKENGIDPVLMEAIMRHESGHGKSNAARTRNNLAGIMGRKGLRSYSSKAECVSDLGKLLAKYKAKGRVTVAQIGKIYCQDKTPWASHINAQMRNIRAGKYGAL